jgi:transposase
MLRQYIQPKQVERLRQATVRYETEPVRPLQGDWDEPMVEIGGKAAKVYFILNQLDCSRRFQI